MRTEDLRGKIRANARLAGTFVKTPDVAVIEVLALSGLDFVVLDAEHAPWDRGRLDACLAMARALDLPALVRVISRTPDSILAALDSGAVGVVVPHVNSVDEAEAVARAAHFGPGGRGFAGSTRWAGFATQPMGRVLDRDDQTIVIAQIEEPAGLEACEAIAGVEGIDALFAGPADLSVSLGERSLGSGLLGAALDRIGAAARAAGRGYVSWVPDAATAADWAARHGIGPFVVGSEHAFMRAGAAAAAEAVRALD